MTKDIEREFKFRVESLGAVVEKLREVGAERGERSVLERNWLFDRGSRIREAGQVLRLREDNGGTRLTYKGPTSLEDGARVRTEIELGVSDLDAARSLLEALGFEATGYYEKRRGTWFLGSAEIALDETPIGSFVEIEGDRALEVVELIGFDSQGAETESYVALYEEYRKEHPEAPQHMVFGSVTGD